LILKPKTKNCRSDFEVEITKLKLLVLRHKLGTHATTDFQVKPEETIVTGFELKPIETVPVVLRSNH
jgi:hypothetical protein